MAGFGQLLGALILERREAGGFTQIELAEEAFPDLKDHEGKERRIRELELGEVTRPQARNYQPICDVLNITRSEIRELKAKAADKTEQQDAEISEVVQEKGSVEAALSDAATLTRDQLELLASRFEIETPHALSDGKLQQLLTQKAEEYRSYRDQIHALDDRIAGVHNLKAAAQDAAERLDFDEVEELLVRVDRVETEIMVETKEARATNALLRGRVDQAYAIFTAAAESFRELDTLEMALRRDRYRDQLYEHGLRYGGTALSSAIEIQRPGVDALKDTEHKEDWARISQNLATALGAYGVRLDGEEGTKLLAEAAEIFRVLLNAVNRDESAEQWALLLHNLGLTLRYQAERTEGEAGNSLLAEAIDAYRKALTVRSFSKKPLQWALSKRNLSSALYHLGVRTSGDAGIGFLKEAVSVCRELLKYQSKEKGPIDWAKTMGNLATTLQNQGSRTPGNPGLTLLNEALESTAKILEVFNVDQHPIDWAMAKENLSLIELSLAGHAASEHPIQHLKVARGHVEDALTIFNPVHLSYNYTKASRLRDYIQARLDSLEND